MANFRKPRHTWDVDSPQYKARKRNQHKSTSEKKIMYSSEYVETGKFLRNSRKLNNVMSRHSRDVLRSLRSEVGRDEGTGGYHLQDVIKMKKIRHGGIFHDRMAYHIYVDGGTPEGSDFLSAEMRSQFSKEAWRARMGLGKDAPNPTIQPNRSGWVDRALKQNRRGL